MDGQFKVPALPGQGGQQKRKLPEGSSSNGDSKRQRPSHDPLAQVSKTAGLKTSKPPPGPMLPPSIPLGVDKGKGKAATVEDGDEEDGYGNGNGSERGDEMDVDEERYEEEETFEADDGDEEGGRFFGGGTSAVQDTILDIFQRQEDSGQPLTSTGPQTVQELRKLISKFEIVVRKNTESRAKHSDQPALFIDSESDLDTSLHQFLPLPSNPLLFYPELIKSENLIPTLANLLTHENTDIAIDVIEVIDEWVDEDVGVEEMEESGNEEYEAAEEGKEIEGKGRKVRMLLGGLITSFVDNSLLELLVSNLSRFNEVEEIESSGVFKVLSIFESLLAFLPPLARQIAETTDLIQWLLKRIGEKEMDSNKLYASEVLSVLCQEDRTVRLRVAELGGVDSLLVVLSQYRKKDPSDMEEAEFMENCFNALCGILAEPEMKKTFNEAEGVELMVMLLREKNMAKLRAIKVLDYALGSEEGTDNCIKFVEALGLKSLFSVYMGKGLGKKSKISVLESIPASETEEHILKIMVSLFTNLVSDTAPRIRLLAKFVEGEYEKVDRLIELRDAAEQRVVIVSKDVEEEKQIMEENGEEITDIEISEWYLRKLGSGLDTIQNADFVLAWLCMEDDGALQHAKMLFSRRGKSLAEAGHVLADWRDELEDDVPAEDESSAPEPSLQRIVLDQLATFMYGLEEAQ